MRIALLVDAFRSLGGIEEIVDYLAVEFIRSGHQAIVISTPNFEPGCERTPRTTAECVYVEIPSRKAVSLRHLERLVKQPEATALIDHLRRWRPDIVNTHIWQWDKFATVADACRAAGIPFVQSFDTDEWGRGKLGLKPLRALDRAADITVLSEAVKRNLAMVTGAISSAHVIIGGVDCESAAAAPPYRRDRAYVFAAARLDLRHKAIDVLIDAFAAVAGDFPQFDLLIAGDGPDRAKLVAQIEYAGLGSRVEMLGALAHSDLWTLYKGATVFAMPSRSGEAMGLIFLEAMACGIPVIATRSGGIPEIMPDGRAGLLIDHAEQGELARAIGRLLDDPALASRMGRTGRELAAAKYSWTAIAQRFLEVYRACL